METGNYNRDKRRRALQKKKREKQIIARTCLIGVACIIIMLLILLASMAVKLFFKKDPIAKVVEKSPDFEVQLLTVNDYSRPGTALNKINGIVIHYTANPGTTAQQNRDYFEGLKDSHETRASSHFVIGIDGEIIQCIPSSEISYASNERNSDTISIECCHPDESGKFTDATYKSLVSMTAWLCGKFNVDVENVIRHYDVTGKMCPKYYVEHNDAWVKFKQDVSNYIKKYGVEANGNGGRIE